MSFDVMFIPREANREALNPGEAAVLSRVMMAFGGPAAPDQHGYFFELPDGGYVEFFFGGTANAMLALRSNVTLDHGRFMFELMKALDWCWFIAGDDEPCLVAARAFAGGEEPPAPVPVLVLSSPEEILEAIAPGHEAWSGYGDRVVGGRRDEE